ncbi:PLD nuclease N-terminal domain-containing protein [Streptomyces sp. 3330]|uniref:PLD nuclease N-terminal domain-containing protein n=1 Tax=Streptomyces sp. 3330 TaxID=2817755 RepID=UPI002869FAAD|nr:PLD nuclease N-terminal domain-containing protein [Streptomyces sp. 3330]
MLGLLDPLAVVPMVLVTVLCAAALLDCVRTAGERVRYVPKPLWLLFMLSAPVVGGLAWVYVGKRPEPRESPETRRPETRRRARLAEPDPSHRSGSGGI